MSRCIIDDILAEVDKQPSLAKHAEAKVFTEALKKFKATRKAVMEKEVVQTKEDSDNIKQSNPLGSIIGNIDTELKNAEKCK